MPGLDGTGPFGTGPFGRGLGPCFQRFQRNKTRTSRNKPPIMNFNNRVGFGFRRRWRGGRNYQLTNS